MIINNYLLILVSFVLLFLIFIAIYCEIRDQKIIIKSKDNEIKRISKKKELRKYFDTISTYPSWRSSVIIAFAITLLFVPINFLLLQGIFPCTEKGKIINYLCVNSLLVFIISVIGGNYLINYFVFHIVCPGWGCSF